MDFNTHKKYAKLDDGEDTTQNMGVVVSDTSSRIVQPEETMDESDKLAKIIETIHEHQSIKPLKNGKEKLVKLLNENKKTKVKEL